MGARWSDGDLSDLAAWYADGVPVTEIARQLGRTYGATCKKMSNVGAPMKRADCVVCHALIEQPKTGRRKRFCGRPCWDLLEFAYEINAWIDSGVHHACMHCHAPLPVLRKRDQIYCRGRVASVTGMSAHGSEARMESLRRSKLKLAGQKRDLGLQR